MGKEKSLLILILLSVFFVSCASKPKNVNSINEFTVLIIDENNQPIPAFTTYISKKGGSKKTYITNNEGLFYVPDFKGKEFVISEGEHKIKFSIGDYEIVRSITAIKGKTYTANFSLDLDISEN